MLVTLKRSLERQEHYTLEHSQSLHVDTLWFPIHPSAKRSQKNSVPSLRFTHFTVTQSLELVWVLFASHSIRLKSLCGGRSPLWLFSITVTLEVNRKRRPKEYWGRKLKNLGLLLLLSKKVMVLMDLCIRTVCFWQVYSKCPELTKTGAWAEGDGWSEGGQVL